MNPRRVVTVAVAVVVLAAAGPASADNALPRTDPQSWSTDGWLGFRFGMGPGDVHAVLRDPRSEMQARTEWRHFEVKAGFSHAYIVDTTYSLLGWPVTATFTFAHGRLVKVFVMQSGTALPELEVDERMGWARKLVTKHSEEHGPPEEFEREWRWVMGGTRIRVGTFGGLSYDDAKAFDAAKALGETAKAAQTRDVEAGRLTNTAEKSWSRVGWGRLRWGMGPADVATRISPSRLVPAVGATNRDSLILQADLGETLYGRYLRARFQFEHGRLSGLVLSDQHAETASEDSMRRWLSSIEEGLRKKYGDGRCEDDDDDKGFHICRWRSKNGANIMTLGVPEDGRYDVGLHYDDARKNAATDHRKRTELDKL